MPFYLPHESRMNTDLQSLPKLTGTASRTMQSLVARNRVTFPFSPFHANIRVAFAQGRPHGGNAISTRRSIQ